MARRISFVRTISTSPERTLDINSATAGKAGRKAFILAIGVLKQARRDFLLARVWVLSSFELIID